MTMPTTEDNGRGYTALPWTYFVGNANGRGLIRIEGDISSEEAGHHIASMARGAVSEANAAFIVRACNSHNDLLEALRGLCLGSAEMEQALWGEFSDDQMGTTTFRLGALRNARAAIAKATATP